MSGIRLRAARGAAEWDLLVDGFDAATAFHRWSWITQEAAVHGWRFLPLIAEHEGRAVGVVPLLIEAGPLRRTPSMPHPYCGPLVPQDRLGEVLRAVRAERRRRMLGRVTFGFPPGGSQGVAAALRSAGWEVRQERTYVVDLRRVTATAGEQLVVLDCLHPKRRWRLRRALRAGVSIRRVDQVDDLLTRVMDDAYGAHDADVALPADLVPWADRLLREGAAVALEAVQDGRRLGVLLALRSGTTMLGWMGGALASARASDAGTVLYHGMLQLALDEGFERLDLVGHVDDGVASFKLSMGAEPAEYLEASDSALVLRAARGLVRASRSRASRSAARDRHAVAARVPHTGARAALPAAG